MLALSSRLMVEAATEPCVISRTPGSHRPCRATPARSERATAGRERAHSRPGQAEAQDVRPARSRVKRGQPTSGLRPHGFAAADRSCSSRSSSTPSPRSVSATCVSQSASHAASGTCQRCGPAGRSSSSRDRRFSMHRPVPGVPASGTDVPYRRTTAGTTGSCSSPRSGLRRPTATRSSAGPVAGHPRAGPVRPGRGAPTDSRCPMG